MFLATLLFLMTWYGLIWALKIIFRPKRQLNQFFFHKSTTKLVFLWPNMGQLCFKVLKSFIIQNVPWPPRKYAASNFASVYLEEKWVNYSIFAKLDEMFVRLSANHSIFIITMCRPCVLVNCTLNAKNSIQLQFGKNMFLLFFISVVLIQTFIIPCFFLYLFEKIYYLSFCKF